jgi:hypothetical protein
MWSRPPARPRNSVTATHWVEIVAASALLTILVRRIGMAIWDHARKTLHVNDNPGRGYCRICGHLTLPPNEGYYRDGVCSEPCYSEFRWRDRLRSLRRPYRARPSLIMQQYDREGEDEGLG